MNDIDLKEFCELLDTALMSKNETVQNALRSLLMVAALVHAEDKGKHIEYGPFGHLERSYNQLRDEVRLMRSELDNLTRSQYKPSPWTTTPNTTQPWYPSTNPGPGFYPSTPTNPTPPWTVTCLTDDLTIK
jgi:hypothetical protein